MIHVAILKPGYINAILEGHKTVESRLTKTMQPPHGKVETGERLFLKASGGPFMATAVAGKVQSYAALTPTKVQQLRKQFASTVGGTSEYWHAKRESRYGTFISLTHVEPITVGPKYKPAHMKAWYVLDDALSPVHDWVITAGALRNRYAMLPMIESRIKQQGLAITLELPDSAVVQTEVASGRRLRWRGWGPIYQASNAAPGDLLRFIQLAKGHYAVRVVQR